MEPHFCQKCGRTTMHSLVVTTDPAPTFSVWVLGQCSICEAARVVFLDEPRIEEKIAEREARFLDRLRTFAKRYNILNP